MSSHESGRTITKKIAKVAVGKSTAVPASQRNAWPRLRFGVADALAGRGYAVFMRGRSGVGRRLALAALLAALVAVGPAVGSAGAVKLTFIGDSKAAGIEFSPKAKRLLSRGNDARRDLKVCRRLVAPSCEYNGVIPLTALEAVRHYGTGVGRVLVIDVGYNDQSGTYSRQLDRVMRAALARGVRGVVWVNLKAVRPDYRKINSIINRARQRWPELYVANWNKHQEGHPGWFADWDSEKIHLSQAGAVGLVRLVRRYIPLAAEGPRESAAAETVDQAPTTTEEQPAPDTATVTAGEAADLTGNGPPVGTNLGGGSGSSALESALPFVAGAALMLFLVFVTVKRRRAA
jgi:hypothetical protein